MGEHSGYDQLCDALSGPGVRCSSYWRERTEDRTSEEAKSLGRLRRLAAGTKFYNQDSAAIEEKVIASLRQEPALVHLLYAENNLGLLRNVRYGSKLVATVHQPAEWWQAPVPAAVPGWGERGSYDVREFFHGVDALIALSSEGAEFFRSEAGVDAHFIPHGVDVEFFHPVEEARLAPTAGGEELVCVTVGHWLRDFETLDQVIGILGQAPEKIRFDLLVPDCGPHPQASAIARLRERANVRWVGRLSDQELRRLYQQANLLLLPLVASGANNALLEALATGLPVVSTLTAGTVDYTSSACAKLTAPGAAEEMAAAALTILSAPDLQLEMGREARSLAVSRFSWPTVASETLGVYRQVTLN
jgi:glycosyltransferase involved in cell wall biosynthesis